jgi:hypothetical protein
MTLDLPSFYQRCQGRAGTGSQKPFIHRAENSKQIIWKRMGDHVLSEITEQPRHLNAIRSPNQSSDFSSLVPGKLSTE